MNQGGIEPNFSFKKDLSKPVMADMEVEIVVYENGKFIVLHDRPFPYEIASVEYDRTTAEINFIYKNEQQQPLGMQVPGKYREILTTSEEAYIVRLDANKEVIVHSDLVGVAVI